MQTHRGDYFIRKDFGFYDSGLIPVVGMATLYVYEMLRRFVWRSVETGDPEIVEMVRQGMLVTKVAHQTIAKHLGYSRRQTVTQHVALLKELGWLKVIPLKNSGCSAHVLGERVIDSMGSRHEVFFADAKMASLWDALTAHAKTKKGAEATPNSLDIEERIEFVQQHLKLPEDPANGSSEGGVSVKTDRGEGGVPFNGREECDLTDRGCPLKRTQKEGEFLKENNRENKGSADALIDEGGLGNFPSVDVDDSSSENEDISDIPKSENSSATSESVVNSGNSAPVLTSAHTTPVVSPRAPGDRDLESLVERLATRAVESRKQRATEAVEESQKRNQKLTNLQGSGVQKPSLRGAIGVLETHWREEFGKAFPDLRQAKWGAKEKGQAGKLFDLYDGTLVKDGMTYLVSRWSTIRERMFKKGGANVPSLGLLLAMHPVFMAEAQQYTTAMRVKSEWDLCANDPYASIPRDLEDRWAKAKKDLLALGIT